MILFAGIPSEPPMALAIASAEAAGAPHLVLNQRQCLFSDLSVEVSAAGPRGRVWFDETVWPLEDFTGLYARAVDVVTLPEVRPRGRRTGDGADYGRALAWNELLTDWLDIAPGCVINRPAAMASNVSKPYQAQLIAACGLSTPPTIVTNDGDAVRAFHARHGRIIYKSTSSIRSIVREWTPADAGGLERLAVLPTQFQALIEGVDVRVHVVGDAVFASEVRSPAIDYRYAGRDGLDLAMAAIDLPEAVEATCVALASALGLTLAGIDLRRTADGEWFCFEVNPSPAYSYYQEHTGQPISDAIVQRLVDGG